MSERPTSTGGAAVQERRQGNQERLLTVSEVAQRLRVHVNTVRSMADRGVIEAYRIPGSRHRRFEAHEVERVLQLMRGASERAPEATTYSELP